jgi:NADH dehydrogenase [ubiquinone] 1 alpha subcomplex assembly factor 1
VSKPLPYALQSLTAIALTFEGLDLPSKPYPILTFDNPESVKQCVKLSDADFGGKSQSLLDFVPGSDTEPDHAQFHGTISTELPKDKPSVLATGYAGFRSADRKFSLFGLGLLDIERYRYLALRVKSDGRKYLVNIQTDSIEPTDLHQHRLYISKPGVWETVLIDLNEFVRTNSGALADPQSDMMTAKVNSVGLSLTDRVEGPFQLCIERIWASNGMRKEGRVGNPETDRFYKSQNSDGTSTT